MAAACPQQDQRVEMPHTLQTMQLPAAGAAPPPARRFGVGYRHLLRDLGPLIPDGAALACDLLSAYADFDDGSRCFASLETLAAHGRCSQRTIRRRLREAEAAGLVEIRNSGWGNHHTYQLTERPFELERERAGQLQLEGTARPKRPPRPGKPAMVSGFSRTTRNEEGYSSALARAATALAEDVGSNPTVSTWPPAPSSASSSCPPPLDSVDANTTAFHGSYVDDSTLHRQGGPAIKDADGTHEWWVDGQRHRLDGPAVEDADGKPVPPAATAYYRQNPSAADAAAGLAVSSGHYAEASSAETTCSISHDAPAAVDEATDLAVDVDLANAPAALTGPFQPCCERSTLPAAAQTPPTQNAARRAGNSLRGASNSAPALAATGYAVAAPRQRRISRQQAAADINAIIQALPWGEAVAAVREADAAIERYAAKGQKCNAILVRRSVMLDALADHQALISPRTRQPRGPARPLGAGVLDFVAQRQADGMTLEEAWAFAQGVYDDDALAAAKQLAIAAC